MELRSARYDYTMTELGSLGLLRDDAGSDAEELAWFEAFPAWAVAAWAIGVWGSVLGSILLLLRSRHAATAFLLSLARRAGQLRLSVHVATSRPRWKAALAAIMPVVILILIVAQWYYARRQAAAGVLR